MQSLNQGQTPIISPDSKSKPTISRTRSSTLIPRGIHGDRKTQDKPITSPSQRNKPESSSDRKPVVKKINPLCLEGPATQEWLRGSFLIRRPRQQRWKLG